MDLRDSHNSQQTLFRSFLMGGFECSTHRLPSGRRLDVIDATGHERHAESDYAALARQGILTIRDGLRWHLIETRKGIYDFSSVRSMLQASQAAGVQPIGGIAEIRTDEQSIRELNEAMVSKYGLMFRLVLLAERVIRRGGPGRIVLRITEPAPA